LIRGLYTSATGMLALMSKQDVISNNLANVNTTGYKKDYISVRSFPEALVYAEGGRSSSMDALAPIGQLSAGVGIGKTGFINSNGNLRQTGGDFDLALAGDGLFTVKTPAGEMYTRNGNFGLDSLGRLVNQDGHLVMGESRPVKIEGDDVVVDVSGRIFVDGSYVDTLKIRRFNEEELRKAGSNAFVASSKGEVVDAVVRQGYLEGSNVDVVSEMVEMIAMVRSFEANQRILKSQDELMSRAVNDVGRLA